MTKAEEHEKAILYVTSLRNAATDGRDRYELGVVLDLAQRAAAIKAESDRVRRRLESCQEQVRSVQLRNRILLKTSQQMLGNLGVIPGRSGDGEEA